LNQSITPELRQWIIDQAAVGFAPEAVVQAMRAAGWQEDVAVHALETTLQDLLKERTSGMVPGGAPMAVTVAVPDIDLSDSPRQIDLGDRVVEVLASVRLPRVVLLGGLLSDEECDGLIVAARPRMARSLKMKVQPVVTEILPGGRGYVVHFRDPWPDWPTDDAEVDARRMNAWIEDEIRANPSQYLWVHKRFKTRPPGEASLY